MTLALAMFLFAGQAIAQQMPPIPKDKEVRMGKLDNGLTYYIRHNDYPKDVANFYIAQRVGSINEEENQRGLAHFLEHMAFNGSENFPGNGIIEFTRGLGVEFGSNLNAYTSIDQTVYRICDVPTARQTALDSCLLVLKDWSCGLLLEDEEIDKERGVIHQEWQMGSDPFQRFADKHLEELYPGSKYGKRLPIGLMSVVDNFEYQALRDYYHKWYRPDNQAIIVIGNVDVDHIEAEIKKLWNGVKVDPNAAKVTTEAVPDNEEPIYVTYQDKEQKYSIISVNMKHDAMPDSAKSTLDYLILQYGRQMAGMMINMRLQELMQQPDCPFVSAGVSYGQFMGISKPKDAFELQIVPKEGKDIEALTVAMREVERARQFGFTETEYARAKADYLSSLEQLYTNRDKTSNTYFYNLCVGNYLANEPMPGIEDEYTLMNQIVPNIPVAAINMLAAEMISKDNKNLVVYQLSQEAPGKVAPSADQLHRAIDAVRAEKLEAYVDNVKNEPLIAQLPQKGSIVSTTEDQKLGFKKLTLSNGATVILKKTDFQDDEVKMRAEAKGGMNKYGEADFVTLGAYDYIAGSCGLGNFSVTELQKALAGKKANANPSLGLYTRSLNAYSTPKDVETMMQLSYLYFTDMRKDEKACQSTIAQLEVVLKNKDLQPESVFSDSLQYTRYCHNPRFAPLRYDDLKKVNADRVVEITKEMFADASEFTFYIVGNYDEATLLPLIEQYIASLPSSQKQPKKVEAGQEVITYPNGAVANHFSRKMETPKAQLYKIWRTEKVPYTLENSVLVDAAGQIVNIKLLRTIREENSAAYSVGGYGFNQRTADDQNYLQILAGCPMDPAKADLAHKLMEQGVTEMAQTVEATDLQKVKEFMLKQAKENARNNSHWLGVLSEYCDTGLDIQTDYEKTVNALTPEKIAAFMKGLLSTGDSVEVLMTPEK